MRVTIERSSFLRALNHVQSVVERRNTIPILSNVLIQAAGGNLRLTATDLDIEIVETVAAEVGQEGAATVPAHMLYDIVRKLPEGAQLELDQGPDAGRISIIAGKLALCPAGPAARGFPRSRQRRTGQYIFARRRRPQGPDRENPLCHLDRRDPLLPERHLSA